MGRRRVPNFAIRLVLNYLDTELLDSETNYS